MYDFEHPTEESGSLANELSALRLEIKQIVAQGSATENFTFNNSAAKGKKFVKDMSKTMLSAYSAEVEKNVTMINLHIAPRYHRMRIDELALAARHLEAVKAAKEAERERRRRRRSARREARGRGQGPG